MRRAWPLVVAMLAGCHSPDDVMWLRGVVEQAPRSVELLRSQDAMDFCTAPAPWRTQDSDADGGYGFQVVRAEVEQPGRGWPLCLVVRTRFESGTEHRVDWPMGVQASLELPPLRDWAPDASIESDGGVVRLTRPEGCVTSPFTADRLTVRQGDDVVWSATAASSPLDGGPPEVLSLPPEALEDFTGLTLSLETARPGCSEGVEGVPPRAQTLSVLERWRAGEVVLASGNMAPASRGVSCDTATPCPFTDARLTPVVLPPGTTVLRFDLAQPVPVRQVALRGLVNASDRVTVRAGGSSGVFPLWPEAWPPDFNAPPRADGAPRFVLLGLGFTASHFELEFDQPVEQLAEVSFFE